MKNKFPKLLQVKIYNIFTLFTNILNQSEWIAPNCTIIGDIETGKYSSLYHGVIVRGDTAKVTIGKNTQIQDNTQILSTDLENKNAVINIGDNVVIGIIYTNII